MPWDPMGSRFTGNGPSTPYVVFPSMSAMIKTLIDHALIIENLDASTKQGAIPEIMAAVGKSKFVPAGQVRAIVKQLHEREALGSTGIGNGVAVPHVKSDKIKDLWLVLARSLSGVDYQAIDGRPVHTIFLMGAPASRAEDHLQCLRWVSTLARNPDFRRFVMDADGSDAIRELLHEMSAAS